MTGEQSSYGLYSSNNNTSQNQLLHQQQFKHCGLETLEQPIPQQNYYIPPVMISMGIHNGMSYPEELDGCMLGRSRGDSLGFLPLASSNFEELNYLHQEQITSNNYFGCEQPLAYQTNNGQQAANSFGEDCIQNKSYPMLSYAPIHPPHHTSSNISCHLQEPYFNYNQLLNASSNYSGSSYNNTNCQLSTPSQQYLQQEQIHQTNNHLPIYNQTNFFQYGQNPSTSLQNLCFDYETMIGTLPEDKPGKVYGVQDAFAWQENNNLQDNLEKDNDNFHNVAGHKHGKKRFIQRNTKMDNLAFGQPWPCLMEKSTEKIKQKRKQTGNLNEEYAMTIKEQDNISSDSSPQKRQPKKQSLSEATTVFDHIEHNTNDIPSTPYKKIKLNEFSLKNSYPIVSQNEEQLDNKNPNDKKNNYQVVFPQVENQFNTHKKLQITTEKTAGVNSVTHDGHSSNKMNMETLQGIMKSLPFAYLPFLHKRQSDSQKLEYLKRYHNTALQVDLSKLRQLLPPNFIKSFDINPSEVYSNAFIMEGIRRNLPDESAKKIGPLTKRERRDKINKYKQKRNKRASCRKVSYDVRKRVADSRLRVKGRFVTKDQALQMIGDISGDIDRYSNQELRALLVQRFGSEINNDYSMPV